MGPARQYPRTCWNGCQFSFVIEAQLWITVSWIPPRFAEVRTIQPVAQALQTYIYKFLAWYRIRVGSRGEVNDVQQNT